MRMPSTWFPPAGRSSLRNDTLAKRSVCGPARRNDAAAAVPAGAALEIEGTSPTAAMSPGSTSSVNSLRSARSSGNLRSIVTRSRPGLVANGKASSIPAFSLGDGNLRDALRRPCPRPPPGIGVMKRIEHGRLFSGGKATGNQQKTENHGDGPFVGGLAVVIIMTLPTGDILCNRPAARSKAGVPTPPWNPL